MLHSVRRAAALVAVPSLALAALAVLPGSASAAETDPAPAAAAGTWLTAQLDDGLIYNDQYGFDDLGLSGDVALGLAGLGGHDATVQEIAAAIEPRAHDEWYTSTYMGVTSLYAGSLAKAAALAQAAGSDATDFGGEDLIATLEDTVSPTGATEGRVQDENNDYGDTNTFGQAYAAQALDAAGSLQTDRVTDFLLGQQCDAGWFRLDFAERDAADQTCDGDAASVPDTDATAIAVLALIPQDDDTEVAAKLALAATWLKSAQGADGSFGGGPSTEKANANSTGLAAWALGELGESAAATEAAVWVRAHQVVNVGECAPYAATDLGAIAYDDDALEALQTSPVDATTRDQIRRSTSQSAPALRWVPSGAGDPQAMFTAEYVRAGGKKSVGVSDATPGEALCAIQGEQSVLGYADANGEADLKIQIADKTKTTKVKVANAEGTFGTVEINALAAKKLTVKAKAKVRKGKKQTVTVKGLAPAESVKVKLRGKTDKGKANKKGVFTTKVKATGKPGKAKVKVSGQFGNRKGSKTVKVVR